MSVMALLLPLQSAWAIEPLGLDQRCGLSVGEGVYGLFRQAEEDLLDGKHQAAVTGYQRVHDPLRRLKDPETRIRFTMGYAARWRVGAVLRPLHSWRT